MRDELKSLEIQAKNGVSDDKGLPFSTWLAFIASTPSTGSEVGKPLWIDTLVFLQKKVAGELVWTISQYQVRQKVVHAQVDPMPW